MVKAIGISTPPEKPWMARRMIICCRFSGEGTGDREDQEQHRVDQQIVADREDPGQPAAERNDDDLGDQIGGRDPAAIVGAGADRALDVGERCIDDLDVEDRHEGAERGADDGCPHAKRAHGGFGRAAEASRAGRATDCCLRRSEAQP